MMRERGFTLIEVLVSVAVFLIVVSGAFAAYRTLFASMALSRTGLAGAGILSERFEFLRSLPYEEVTSGSEAVTRAGREFSLITEVEESGHKLVEVRVECPGCADFSPLRAVGVFVNHDEE